ncbi:MAG: ParA family protein [Gorillibacterium sp.]|nr:ParA family protein [Gorillibacterium sp.]
MTKVIITFVNQKGDVGKTTTAVSLRVGLVKEGERVLLVDADAKRNLTNSLAIGSRTVLRKCKDEIDGYHYCSEKDVDHVVSRIKAV